ncbi:hypothetical protein OSTOST_14981 [Ostertagia ostertagi]
MFIFIIVELPQGLLAVLSTVTELQLIVVLVCESFTEMITLLTSCIIFALFCLMNGKIRSAFKEAPCFRWLERWTRHAIESRIGRSVARDKLLDCSITTKKAVDTSNNYAVL